MAEISAWSTTAGSNTSAPPDGAPEGWAPSTVNNTVREIMAVLARWYSDTNGALTSGGSANAYTLTPNRTISAYAAGQVFVFKSNHTNTGAATLNVSSLGAKDIRKGTGSTALAAGDILSGQVCIVTYDGTQFQLLNSGAVNAQNFLNSICDGRLTLESGVPVSTSDQTAKTSVYLTPYKGNRIALYDGTSRWEVLTFSELTFSLSGLAADTNYDLFVYNNAGTPTARSPVAWTDATTRATALTTQNGVYVKSGATTDRYVGTVRTTGTIGQTQIKFGSYASGGGEAWFGIWSAYNRVRAPFFVADSAGSWTYSGTTYRASNNSATARVSQVVGLNEEPVEVGHRLTVTNAAANAALSALGLDSTTSPITGTTGFSFIASTNSVLTSFWRGFLGVGFHYVSALEATNNGGTNCTFFGAGFHSMFGTVSY